MVGDTGLVASLDMGVQTFHPIVNSVLCLIGCNGSSDMQYCSFCVSHFKLDLVVHSGSGVEYGAFGWYEDWLFKCGLHYKG